MNSALTLDIWFNYAFLGKSITKNIKEVIFVLSYVTVSPDLGRGIYLKLVVNFSQNYLREGNSRW